MFTTALFIVVVAISLFAISLFVVWRFDTARIYDHIARSLVQMAIAIATVFVAFAILDKQLEQRDREEKQKEQLIVSSFMHSKILEAQSIYISKRADVLIKSTLIKCDRKMEACKVRDPKRRYEAAEELKRLIFRDPNALDLTLAVNRAEVWQLIRSAPLVDKSYFHGLLSVFDTLEERTSSFHRVLRTWDKFRSEFETIPIDTKIELYEQLVLAQSVAILSTLRAVCHIEDVLLVLETGKQEGYDPMNVDCSSAKDSALGEFLRNWKSSQDENVETPPTQK
jgi:hypothetical protein